MRDVQKCPLCRELIILHTKLSVVNIYLWRFHCLKDEASDLTKVFVKQVLKKKLQNISDLQHVVSLYRCKGEESLLNV